MSELPPTRPEDVILCAEGVTGPVKLDPLRTKTILAPRVDQKINVFLEKLREHKLNWSESVHWRPSPFHDLALSVDLVVWCEVRRIRLELQTTLEWGPPGRPFMRHAHIKADNLNDQVVHGLLETLRAELFELTV